MTIRPARAAALLVACLSFCARCGRASERGESAGAASDTTASTIYRRRVLFVGGSPDSLVTALLHFTAAPIGQTGVRHGAYGWVGSGIGFEPLATEEWSGDPLRDPGLILPHGGIRVVAGANDELAALEYGRARLERGPSLAEWAQPDAIRLTLAAGRFADDGHGVDGAVLVAEDAPQPPPAPSDTSPTVEALLMSGADAYLVLEQRGDIPASSLWVEPGGEATRSGSLAVRVDPAGALDEDGRPTAWLIVDADGRRVGTLHRIGPGWAGSSAQLGYRHFDGVRGELQQDGRRHRIAGILERRAR